MKMEQTDCSETSEYKIQTPGNYPEESIQHSEQVESLKLWDNSCCYGVENPPAHGTRIDQSIDGVWGNNQRDVFKLFPSSVPKVNKLRFRNTIGPRL
jgi:hypothetical protein